MINNSINDIDNNTFEWKYKKLNGELFDAEVNLG